MNLHELLGLKLKDDEMLVVLEDYAVLDVIYSFDRTHENEPDVYWAGAKEKGFLLRFNQHQACDVVFCYVQPNEGYEKVDPAIVGVTMYPAFEAAQDACNRLNLKHSVAGATMQGAWLRVEEGAFLTHYQFKDGSLSLVTLSARDSQ